MENNEGNNNNKKLVDKTKKFLNEMGYDIKTGQVYELYSKILNHPNYNVAKSKNEDFEKVFNNINLKDFDKNSENLSNFEKFCKNTSLENLNTLYNYLESLSKGDFKDKMFYGVSKNKEGFALLNQLINPNSLYVGKMGSGKSVGMKATLLTHILANSESTVYFIYDEQKGASDYKQFFKLDNCVYSINDKSKIVLLIDTLHNEMIARMKLSQDRTVVKDLARIVCCFEEFHSIIHNPNVDYQNQEETEGSTAFKLKQLFRVGSSYGITFLVATQTSKYEDLPRGLATSISMVNAFKPLNYNHEGAFNKWIELALKLPLGCSGRCIGNEEFGEIQYPYFRESEIDSLLKNYKQDLKFELLSFNLQSIKNKLSDDFPDTLQAGSSMEHVFKVLEEKESELLFENSNDTSMMNKIKTKIFPKSKTQSIDLKKLVNHEMIELCLSQESSDAFYLGIEQDSKKLNFQNFFNLPNALFLGKMGSGKTIASRTALLGWFLRNSQNSSVFIIDPLHDAPDYRQFLKKDSSGKNIYPQIKESLSNLDESKKIIDLAFSELDLRFKSKIDVKKDNKLNRIVIVIDNFDLFLSSINYNDEFKVEGTTAYKINVLLKAGRQMGIWFLCSSISRGTGSSIPSSVSVNFNKCVFKSSRAESELYLGHDKASSLNQGELYSDFSDRKMLVFSGFSFIDDYQIEYLLRKLVKKPQGYNLVDLNTK